jgi:integrase
MKDSLQFLMTLVNKGLSYSTINTAQSALSNIITEGECRNFGSHQVVTRFMKAVFETRHPVPKCTTTWDVSTVLKHLATLHPNSGITLKTLSLKLVMLLLLLSGQRGQTIYLLNLDGLNITNDTCKFQLLEHIKTSKPGQTATMLTFKKYTENQAICPLLTLNAYLARTNPLRGEEKQLLISYQRPHKAISRDIMSRWVKMGLTAAGIDTTVFTPHSTRAASTSKAKARSVPMDIIMSLAGWSNATTSQRFYNKEIINNEDNMACALLSSL